MGSQGLHYVSNYYNSPLLISVGGSPRRLYELSSVLGQAVGQYLIVYSYLFLKEYMSMEWKKPSKTSHCKKNSRSDIKISFSIHEKQTKRRKQSRHKKVLTEGACPFALNHRATMDSGSPLSKIRQDQTTFSSQPPNSYSQSHSVTHSGCVFRQIDQFAQDFEKENDRIRAFIKELQSRSSKIVRDSKLGGKKEGLTQKIKKQNIMLKASFSPKVFK